VSNQFSFKWRRAKNSSPSRKDESRPSRSPDERAQPGPAADETRAVPEPAAEASRPPHEQIAVRAYELWESQGRPDGVDRENWFEAQRRLGIDGR